MTMTNAEWMIQNGMKFSKLTWGHISGRNIVYYEPIENIAAMTEPASTTKELYSEESASPKNIILKWLDMEHVEQILDEAENKYLSAVIRPFRDKVKYIEKFEYHFSSGDFEQISIRIESNLNGGYEKTFLPTFIKGTMYKGMKQGKHYTLEELGL